MDLRRPPKLPNTASRLIAMAAGLLGSTDEVRTQLECSPEDFEAYRWAKREPPLMLLDRLVALIVLEQGKVVAKNRELLKELRAKRGE